MRPQLISIFVVSLTLWPLIMSQQEQGLETLQSLLGNYQEKLKSTIDMIRGERQGAAGVELGEAKQSLSKVIELVQADPALAKIPGIKEPLTQLTQLTDKINLNLDNLFASLSSVFNVLGQVTNKVQESAGSATGQVSGGLPIG